jgi:Leucine-rich repeat (LRR) protein
MASNRNDIPQRQQPKGANSGPRLKPSSSSTYGLPKLAWHCQELPQKVWEIQSAKILDATNNRITSLPPSLAALGNLQRLILASNQIFSLPAAITALTTLRVLPQPVCVHEA